MRLFGMSARETLKRAGMMLVVSVCVCAAGCSSVWKIADLQPVGPVPNGPVGTAPGGYLKVYSATVQHEVDDNMYYYPHRSYFIYDAQGKDMIKRVQNHVGTMDETPALVALAPGRYKVLADDEGYGRIMFPVVIRPRQTTVLHLDGAWEPPAHTSDSEVVRLPDGEYIGWSAASHGQAQVSTPTPR